MNLVVLEGNLISKTEISVSQSGKANSTAVIAFNKNLSKARLVLVGPQLIDKAEAFFRKGVSVIVKGRLVSTKSKTSELVIYVDDIGFVNATAYRSGGATEKAVMKKVTEIEEEFVEIEGAMLE